MRFGFGFGLNSYAYVMAGGIPPDSQGAIGDVALDTATQVWYEKRWVANREGAGDSILFPINLFPSAGDFDFSVRIRQNATLDSRLMVSTSSPTQLRNADLQIGGVGDEDTVVSLMNAGVAQYAATTPNLNDGVWHTIRATRVGIVLSLYRDGVLQSSVANTSGWTPVSQSSTQVLGTAPFTSSTSIKCCDLKLTGPGGSIIARLDEGAGTTITNQAGANGTLTDGSPTNFWYAAWVPILNPSLDFRIPTNSGIFPALFS